MKVAYEGPEEFLDSKLPKLITDVTTLAKQVPVATWGYKLGVINFSRNGCPTANVNRLSIDADICKRR